MCRPVTWKVNFRPLGSSLPARRGYLDSGLHSRRYKRGSPLPPPCSFRERSDLASRTPEAAEGLGGRAATGHLSLFASRDGLEMSRPAGLKKKERKEKKKKKMSHTSAGRFCEFELYFLIDIATDIFLTVPLRTYFHRMHSYPPSTMYSLLGTHRYPTSCDVLLIYLVYCPIHNCCV